MLYLSIIYHNHQPYYKNLLTNETDVPWVRLHGTKDYLDMVEMLDKFPDIHLTFNMVPSLMEQIEDYQRGTVRDAFLDISRKKAAGLSEGERQFVTDHFFMINADKVIAMHPRYYELYFKAKAKKHFSCQDMLDLQVWFNLAWIDPLYRGKYAELKAIVNKGRFFTEADKTVVLDKQLEILKNILPGYAGFTKRGLIETIVSPYYHPILPLLYNTNLQMEARRSSVLPARPFSFPEDAQAQIFSAVDYFKSKFDFAPAGMWPSEESVCEHIVPMFIRSGIRWIVTDEAVLFRSLKMKKRDSRLLYQPHVLKRRDGELFAVFRDRGLSDLIGFTYPNWDADDAVDDFMRHMENTAAAFGNEDILVTVALDGENAWEYYRNDGHDFLELLYEKLSASDFVKVVTPGEYFKIHPPVSEIKRLAAGSWIYGEFSKWINNPYKNKGWEYLAVVRHEMQDMLKRGEDVPELAWKQLYICEGSDWYWWFGEDYPGYFDRLYRMHMSNLYTLLGKPVPHYLSHPIIP